MKRRLSILAVGCLFTVQSFAGRIELGESDNKLTKAGVISVSAEWVKDKGKKYDLGFKLKNEHDKGIIVKLAEIRCYRGEAEGEAKHTFFNTGEKTIDLRPGQLKRFTLVCRIGEKSTGPYRVVVTRVYENASGDGRTLGKVLAQELDWRLTISED